MTYPEAHMLLNFWASHPQYINGGYAGSTATQAKPAKRSYSSRSDVNDLLMRFGMPMSQKPG